MNIRPPPNPKKLHSSRPLVPKIVPPGSQSQRSRSGMGTIISGGQLVNIVSKPKKLQQSSSVRNLSKKKLNSARGPLASAINIEPNDQQSIECLEVINQHLENMMRPLDQLAMNTLQYEPREPQRIQKAYNSARGSQNYNSLNTGLSHQKTYQNFMTNLPLQQPKKCNCPKNHHNISKNHSHMVSIQNDIQILDQHSVDSQKYEFNTTKPITEIDELMSKYRGICDDLDADIKQAAQKIREKPHKDLERQYQIEMEKEKERLRQNEKERVEQERQKEEERQREKERVRQQRQKERQRLEQEKERYRIEQEQERKRQEQEKEKEKERVRQEQERQRKEEERKRQEYERKKQEQEQERQRQEYQEQERKREIRKQEERKRKAQIEHERQMKQEQVRLRYEQEQQRQNELRYRQQARKNEPYVQSQNNEIYIEQSSESFIEQPPNIQIEMLDQSLMSSHLEEQFQFKNSEIRSPGQDDEFEKICEKLQCSTYEAPKKSPSVAEIKVNSNQKNFNNKPQNSHQKEYNQPLNYQRAKQAMQIITEVEVPEKLLPDTCKNLQLLPDTCKNLQKNTFEFNNELSKIIEDIGSVQKEQQISMNSQNTADFTKDIQSFDLDKQDTLASSDIDHLKQTLNLALDVIVKLSKTLPKKRSDNELGKLEDIDSLASLQDLLRFIKTDEENLIIREKRIQTMIKDSKKVVKQVEIKQNLFQQNPLEGTSGFANMRKDLFQNSEVLSPKNENLFRNSTSREDQNEISEYRGMNHVSSPVSDSKSESNQNSPVVVETFRHVHPVALIKPLELTKLSTLSKPNMSIESVEVEIGGFELKKADLQTLPMESMLPLEVPGERELLTLRNHEIFQEVRDSNIFSQNVESESRKMRTISEDQLFDNFKSNTKSILDELAHDEAEAKKKSKNSTTRLSQSDLILNDKMSQNYGEDSGQVQKSYSSQFKDSGVSEKQFKLENPIKLVKVSEITAQQYVQDDDSSSESHASISQQQMDQLLFASRKKMVSPILSPNSILSPAQKFQTSSPQQMFVFKDSESETEDRIMPYHQKM